jgi:uncharacterized membrane protein
MVRHLIELSAQGIEALAVAIIVVAIAHGTIRYLMHIHRQVGGAYEQYKVQLGKALLLGLEFLVAADIVRTVALEPTLQNVMILGLLVLVCTFLSWSLVVEIEGRWPWQAQADTHGRGANEPVGDRGRDCNTGSAAS